jgi:hypothetical protein
MVNTQVTSLILERDAVIQARREALSRMKKTDGEDRRRMFTEFFQPLNQRLVTLNRKLGL